MTYVTEQTPQELRAHMRRLQAMPGWHNPLDDRLYEEILALDAELAQLRAAQQPVQEGADCDQAFEEKYKTSSRDPSNEGDLAIWRDAWGAKGADALAAIKAAQEDARRLDWIARQDLDDIVFGVVVDAPHDGEYVVNAGGGPFYGKTFRAAIDAAMGRLLGEDAGRGES